MIQRLESAGLGYHVRADETEECLGKTFIFCMKYMTFYMERYKKNLIDIIVIIRPNSIAPPRLSSTRSSGKYAQSCVGFWTVESRS